MNVRQSLYIDALVIVAVVILGVAHVLPSEAIAALLTAVAAGRLKPPDDQPPMMRASSPDLSAYRPPPPPPPPPLTRRREQPGSVVSLVLALRWHVRRVWHWFLGGHPA